MDSGLLAFVIFCGVLVLLCVVLIVVAIAVFTARAARRREVAAAIGAQPSDDWGLSGRCFMPGLPEGSNAESRPVLGRLVQTRAGRLDGHPVLLGVERMRGGGTVIVGTAPVAAGVEHLMAATPVRRDVTWAASPQGTCGLLPLTPYPTPPRDVVAIGLWQGMGVVRVAKGGHQETAMRYLVSIADALELR